MQSCSIFGNISLAQEICREIRRGILILFSIWICIKPILRRFGFSEAWVKLIQACIAKCWFSVILQSWVQGFFSSSRGLRQGNPPSPSFLIIAEEVLFRALNERISHRDCFTTNIARCSSHLLFANDIILFPCARRQSILKFRTILDAYMKSSVYMIIASKSRFFLLANALVRVWSRMLLS